MQYICSLVGALATAFTLQCSPVEAQVCNDATGGGVVTQLGPAHIGDTLILGPTCGHFVGQTSAASASSFIDVTASPYNAVCDGGTDARAAIQSAIDANPNKTIIIPSNCAVGRNAATAYSLIVNNSVSIIGAGTRSVLKPLASVTTVVDIIYIDPNPAFLWYGYTINNLFIGDPSSGSRNGRDAIRIDTQTTGHQLNKAVFSKIFSTTGAGVGLHHINNVANNPGGAFFSSDITWNTFSGGISLEGSGDSINIVNNSLTGPGPGVFANLVAGAQGPNIAFNNLTSDGGLLIDCGAGTTIGPGNTHEQATVSTDPSGAVINLRGNGCNLINPKIFGSIAQGVLAGQTPTIIRIDKATNATVENMRIGTLTDYAPIVVTVNATNALIGGDVQFQNAATGNPQTIPVANSGTNTLETLTTGLNPPAFGLPYYVGGQFSLAFSAAMTNGQLLVGQTGSAPLPKTLTGDVTLTAAGATTLAAGNAGNLNSGTLLSARLSGSYTGITGTGALAAGSLAAGFSVVGPALGGTGIANNAASTLTISGNFATTLTVTGATGVTLPTAGTLAALGGTNSWSGVNTFTNTTDAVNITTGAITTSGGISAAKQIWAGTRIVVGATTPDAGLFTDQVTATGQVAFHVTSATGAFVCYTDQGVQDYCIGTAHSASAIQFFKARNAGSAGTEIARITDAGGFAINNTTDPGAGGLQMTGQQFIPNITQTSAAQTGTVCWTTGTGKFTVDTTVGCLTSIGAAKNVVGELEPADGLRIVQNLRPVSFKYKNGYGDSGQYEQFGFVAEEAVAVDERLAGRDIEGTLHGVRYMEMTAVLAAAIQQLKSDNDNLRAEFRKAK